MSQCYIAPITVVGTFSRQPAVKVKPRRLTNSYNDHPTRVEVADVKSIKFHRETAIRYEIKKEVKWERRKNEKKRETKESMKKRVFHIPIYTLYNVHT